MKTFDTEELNEIEKMAGLCFTPEQISIVLQVNTDEFCRMYNDKTSIVFLTYQRGALIHETEVRNSIYNLAKGGSSTAQQQYLALMKNRDLSIIKTQ